MTKQLRITIAQLNFLVGDIQGNVAKIISYVKQAQDNLHSDIVVFPELALTGYPPEDLLLRRDFHELVKKGLTQLKQHVKGNIQVVVGYPELVGKAIYNAAAVISDGKIIANYHKQQLPNYGVFDEKRYFKKGHAPCLIHCKGLPIAITICEDLWFSEPTAQAVAAGAKCMICINASPFDIHKLRQRERILRARTQEGKIPIIYAHCVGGQDEIIFDGRSMVMNAESELCLLAPLFEEALLPVDLELSDQVKILTHQISQTLSRDAKVYQALVLGVRDYTLKNGFKSVLLGLSGGIDSALTLCIAVDALGAERVHAVMMPSRFTAQISLDDAKTLAENLGVQYSVISIEPVYQTFLDSLQLAFQNTASDVTEENLQSRCRAVILMALSNKFGHLVLTTGNKSEMAVGYATLYGDMAGGFAVLKDTYKTLVYELAHYRNSVAGVIPQNIIDRAPSAELSEGQTDQDTLPSYDILDQILQRYVEKDQSIKEIVAAGFDAETVKKITKLIHRNEYKRRQAPPGVKITTRAFGRDRRYPITSGFINNF